MVAKIFQRVLGDKPTRTYRRNRGLIQKVNERYEEFNSLSDDQIAAKTDEFKQRLAEGETLDDLMIEAFAVVKQACRRMVGRTWIAGGNEITWELIPYDVQICGAIELHRGNIAEMATGEGKTLSAVMPLYLNALAGKGAHLVTVNDYLAQRDSEWMGPVYEFLGMSVGCILSDMPPHVRRESYHADITYGTNNEFGFDYLRDNMAYHPERLVQRDHFYAIVDEVDSVLIDEARTPLIISGAVDRSIQEFSDLKPAVSSLVQKQNLLVNDLVTEAGELLQGHELNGARPGTPVYEAGIKLLQARKGYPKHRRLMKLVSDNATLQRVIDRVEADFMRDKRVNELEEDLYFVVDERGFNIDLTTRGREALSPDDPEGFVVPDLVEAMSEIERNRELTPEQREEAKEKAMIENEKRTETIHAISQLLRAYTLYQIDVDYVVMEDKVIIVDESTGRLMHGRRWSDGLHQAVEAKEGVALQKETQTLATITLQNYFRMYDKLAGMTGTADTEAQEFAHTYKMGVSVIPTNRPVRRLDDHDLLFKTQREKYAAIIDRVKEIHEQGMPILIGTTSVEVSEKLSRMLQRAKISHSVLNAKQHAHEAQIVRDAGKLGAVTIATNMAGRGTDIKLGPGVIRCKSQGFENSECCSICPFEEGKDCSVNPDLTPCGLQIIGTERHESRRIDNQLRGRSGRQGDPGYSQFTLSLEDDLLRLFANDWMANLMSKGFEENKPLELAGLPRKAIGSAQKKIEDIHFERRKKTLEYDNVMNKQRDAIYTFRRNVLTSTGTLMDEVMDISYEAVAAEWDLVAGLGGEIPDHDIDKFLEWIHFAVPIADLSDLDRNLAQSEPDQWLSEIEKRLLVAYERKIEIFGEEVLGRLSRFVLLKLTDENWRDHLLAIDELREGAWLRSFGQLNPLTEYQREATLLFEDLMYQIRKEVFEHVYRATIVQTTAERAASKITTQKQDAGTAVDELRRRAASQQAEQGAPAGDGDGAAPAPETGPHAGATGQAPPQQRAPKPVTVRRSQPKVGRNDPCPCGSGKKYKKCHGAPGRETSAV